MYQRPVMGTSDPEPDQKSNLCQYDGYSHQCQKQCDGCVVRIEARRKMNDEQEELMATCHLCGLEQPLTDIGSDFRNGLKFCRDRVSCWKRYDKQAEQLREAREAKEGG